MQFNLDKWNELKTILDFKLSCFVATLEKAPDKFWKVENNGFIAECTDIVPYYSYDFNIFYTGKQPTALRLIEFKRDVEKEIVFTIDNLSYEYKYVWSSDGMKATTGIRHSNLFTPAKNIFLNKEDAETYSITIKKQVEEDKLFDETHKKDKDYNYGANGYKDLGWQNSWKDTWYDENGNETTDPKNRKSHSYSKENYPEYRQCRDSGHRTIEISHNNRGSHHDVSCPVCKLVWRYDSSD